MLPADVPAIGWLKTALDNLTLMATNNTAMLQQLTAANLALTATIATLTVMNTKLVEVATCPQGASVGTLAGTPEGERPVGGTRPAKKTFPGNYCWTHGHQISNEYTSSTCLYKAAVHCMDATASNTLGGTKKNTGWNRART